MPQDAAAPASRLQDAVGRVWQDILGLEQVGPEEDFFELGGDSLAAVRMLAALEELLLTQVSFGDFIEAPTVAALTGAIQRARSAGAPDGPALVPRAPAAQAPCSFAQERLWFIDQLAQNTGAYNEFVGARLPGDLDIPALQRSLAAIVARHAALRTHFALRDGAPVQLVDPAATVALIRHDVRDEHELQRTASRLAGEAFDLAQAPLMRAHLLTVAGGEHVLLLVFHHNVCDGASHVVVLRELAALYRAHTGGPAAELPEPRLEYPDYAAWQRERLQGEALEATLAPWRERLAGIPAALDLPTDRPRPAVFSYRGATRRASLGSELTQAIAAFSRAEAVTPFCTLVAALDLVLARYSGQDTIVLGTATAGRDTPELEQVVGLFAHTVTLVSDLAGNPSFRELLRRVQQVVLDAVAHQEAPLQRLVAELGHERDLSRHPIFQVLVSLRPHAPLDLPGAEPFEPDRLTARADLTLWIEDGPDGYVLVWEYASDLFDAATIERIERHFLALLRSGMAEPQAQIGRLAMLSESERREAIARGEARGHDFPVACLHSQFEAHAAQRPEAVALSGPDGDVTYGELNARANRLAQQLRALGVGPETMVALLLERSADLVVAILGVLKAGGGYVPLDPEHPADRLAFVLQDTAAPVLLTQRALRERVPQTGARVLCVEEIADDLPAENPAPLGGPESLAYVIYTSGSTGRPKGVAVEHRQVARLLTSTHEWFSFGAQDTWILTHSYAFDFSVWELWGALAHGGRLVIAPFWVTRSPGAYASLVAAQRVTVLNATPSLFGAIQSELLARADELVLRFVIFGGEALAPSLVAPWFARFGETGATLVNMYGITETTVHTTYRPLRPADCDSDRSPVGVPLPDLSLHVLDPYGEPVALGAPGEIHVGGAGVARGYLNRSDLTAARFIDDPFAPGRLYRSGDLARRRADGELEFLGRIDEQVKIRGFRIELGEIRAVIDAHDGVAKSAVVALPGADGAPRLAAYVVPDRERAPAVRNLMALDADARGVSQLPDGTPVYAINPSETEYLYEEIFVRDDYLRHGIELAADACVVDVGANIGLFALRVARSAPQARIVALEPMPEVHDALRANGALHGLRLTSYPCAAGSAAGTASFSYFPHVTLLSGRYADAGADAAMVRQMLANTGELAGAPIDVEELLAERLTTRTITCPVTTLSQVLAQQGIERVDLLKIDAEKAELDVLAGIEEADWPKVQQLVIEVHGGAERLRAVSDVLATRGFQYTVEEDEVLAGSGLYNVFARRPGLTVAPAQPPRRWHGPAALRQSLLDALAGALPSYMIPASLTFVADLPLTTNGKLDLRRLPDPEPAHERADTFAAPASDTERELAGLWQELLGLDRVGRDDNFFALGGHSLVAARVVARVRERAGIALAVRSLFEAPTLQAFARAVDTARGPARPASASAAGLVRSGAREHPVSFQQQQILYFETLASDDPTYNSAHAVRLTGPFDAGAFARALAALYRRHEVLRTTLVWDAASARQIVSELQPDCRAVDLTGHADPETELARRLRADARVPFDLARQSPLRTIVYRLADEEHVVLFVPHHAAFDARAIEVLYAELEQHYHAQRSGAAPAVPTLPLQYGDFARWQRDVLSGDRLETELQFWRLQLAGAPTRLALATDHPRPAQLRFDGASFVRRLDAQVADHVRALCERHNVTPYMGLLAAFATLLYRCSGQDDILFGGPMANRTRPEFDELIGFFANTVIVRTRLGGNPSFADLLSDVRASVLASYEHQQIPLGLVVDAVRPERDPALHPLVQVNFRVRVGSEPQLTLPECRSEPVAVDLGLARFDLALELHVAPDGIEAQWGYSTALWTEATVQGLAGEFEALLRQICAEPQRRLLDFALGGPAGSQGAPTPAAGGSIRGFRRRGQAG